jgi:hypothetical protein
LNVIQDKSFCQMIGYISGTDNYNLHKTKIIFCSEFWKGSWMWEDGSFYMRLLLTA